MTQVLSIHSSLFAEASVSRQLSTHLHNVLKTHSDTIRFHDRNVVSDEIPHFSAQTITDIGEGKADLADQLITEVQDADLLLIDAPMYNFAIPSQLKSWFDHIARAGLTFRYTENGPQGLLIGKKAIVLATRGGIHKDSITDTQTSYLTTMLRFIGIDDVRFVYAEGLNMGNERRRDAIANAKAEIDMLAADLAHHQNTKEVALP